MKIVNSTLKGKGITVHLIFGLMKKIYYEISYIQ